MKNLQKKSKFGIIDRMNMTTMLEFIPKKTGEPTWKQFFENIKHTGMIKIVYRGRIIATRGM